MKGGTIEKKIEAHKNGACLCIKWNFEGSAIASGGEDGAVRVWSRAGMLRSTLAQTGLMGPSTSNMADKPVYSIAWSADNEQILFASGSELVVKSMQPSGKQIKWKAHEGSVLAVDWSPVTNLVVSGGEDGRYKVWDSYGRLVMQSKAFENAVTSVSWALNSPNSSPPQSDIP